MSGLISRLFTSLLSVQCEVRIRHGMPKGQRAFSDITTNRRFYPHTSSTYHNRSIRSMMTAKSDDYDVLLYSTHRAYMFLLSASVHYWIYVHQHHVIRMFTVNRLIYRSPLSGPCRSSSYSDDNKGTCSGPSVVDYSAGHTTNTISAICYSYHLNWISFKSVTSNDAWPHPVAISTHHG